MVRNVVIFILAIGAVTGGYFLGRGHWNVGGPGVAKFACPNPGAAVPGDDVERKCVPFDGKARGSASAPVTIVEFSDFQCPFCSRVLPTLDRLQKDYAAAGTINFTNLSPILDTLTGPLTVNGTAGNDAINYSVGSSTANGLVTVDSFESTEFSNKTVLTINSGSGNDQINLNNPNTPTGLTSIVVNGGDPTGPNSDTVTFNGTAGADTVNYAVTSANAASIMGVGPTVTIATAEAVVFNGQGGGDALTYTSPTGSNTITFTPGANVDAGSITAQFGRSGRAAVAVELRQPWRVRGHAEFANAGGRVDTLNVVDPTANDTLTTIATTGQIQLLHSAVPINTPGVSSLNLEGLGGADQFTINGPQPYANVLLNGGTSTTDVANLRRPVGRWQSRLPTAPSPTR